MFQKYRNHVTILGPRRVTRSKFHAQDPQILGGTVQNLVSRDLCPPPPDKTMYFCLTLLIPCIVLLSTTVSNTN
jgi:hypothetical protein